MGHSGLRGDKTARTLTASMRSKSATLKSVTGPRSRMPALLTNIEPPKRLAAAATARCRVFGSALSALIASAVPSRLRADPE
jgi:hypothetical protein